MTPRLVADTDFTDVAHSQTFISLGFTPEETAKWILAGLTQDEVSIALMLSAWGEGPEYLEAVLDTGEPVIDYLRRELAAVRERQSH